MLAKIQITKQTNMFKKKKTVELSIIPALENMCQTLYDRR